MNSKNMKHIRMEADKLWTVTDKYIKYTNKRGGVRTRHASTSSVPI